MANQENDFIFDETSKLPTEDDVVAALVLEESSKDEEPKTITVLQERIIDSNNVVRNVKEISNE